MATKTSRLQQVTLLAAACAIIPLAGAAWIQRWTEVAAWGTVAIILLVGALFDLGSDQFGREQMAGILRRARIIGAVDPKLTLYLRPDGGLRLHFACSLERLGGPCGFTQDVDVWPGDGTELAERLERAVEDGLLGARNELYEQG